MRSKFELIAAGLTGAAMAVSTAGARANLIVDGGFETPSLSNGQYEYPNGTLNGWTYANASIGGGLLINMVGGPWINGFQGGRNGNQVAGIQGLGSISQTFTVTYGGTYDVSWIAAGRSVENGVSDGNQTYSVTLYDNTTSSLLSSSATLSTLTNSNFIAEDFTGSLHAGDSYTLYFAGQLAADQTALIDNVGVNQIPEPATLILFGTGLAGLTGMRRQRNIIALSRC